MVGSLTSKFVNSFGTQTSIVTVTHEVDKLPVGQVIASGQIIRPDINNAEYIIYNGAYPGHSGSLWA